MAKMGKWQREALDRMVSHRSGINVGPKGGTIFSARISRRMIDSLERKGWICQTRDDYYTITDAGRAALEPPDAPMVQCEACNGSGKTGPVHINHGNRPHEWRESMPCPVCGGIGQVYAQHAKRIAHGKRLRAARVARGESLRETAARRGMSPSQLSAIEQGRLS